MKKTREPPSCSQFFCRQVKSFSGDVSELSCFEFEVKKEVAKNRYSQLVSAVVAIVFSYVQKLH